MMKERDQWGLMVMGMVMSGDGDGDGGLMVGLMMSEYE